MRTVTCNRGLFLALLLLVGLTPAHSFGAETRIQSDTIFRVFERDTATEEDAAVLPIYEYLHFDTGELEDYGVSLHLYGWGRTDLADSGYFEDQTSGDLLFGYLEYRPRTDDYRLLKFGRQHVFEGVANETIDGLRLSGDFGDSFSLSVYGGQPVGLASEQGRSGDSIVGGRLAHRYSTLYEIGVSYKTADNDGETAEDMLGVDLALFPPADLSLFGFSSYNRESKGWAEHSYELRVPLGDFMLKPYYRHFSYKDYFATGANAVNPFRSLAQSEEDLTAYGVDALWQLDDSWTFGGKFKQHDYDQFDPAQTYSILAAWQNEEQTQYGVEIGRTAAGDVAGNDYTLVRLYGFTEAIAGRFGFDNLSADLLLAQYDEEIYGENSSLFISFGGGKRFMGEALSVKLSGDYSQDPNFGDDLRGNLKVSYTYGRTKPLPTSYRR